MVLCGLYMAYRLSFNDSVIKSSAPVLISQQTTFDRCAIRGELTFSDRLNHFWLLFILSFLRMPFIFAVGCWAVSVVIYLII